MGEAQSQHQDGSSMDHQARLQGAMAPAGTVPAMAALPMGGLASWAPGQDPGANGQFYDPALLTQLVQCLGGRPRNSLLLSDLGALLPGNLRHGVKEKGGLRCWLQKYPELFLVSGQPGKESVTLLLSGDEPAGTEAAALPGSDLRNVAAQDIEQRKKDEDEENEAAVQLRGLPYRATVQDIKTFLREHAKSLKDENSIQLVLNRDGRPSGFARVQFETPHAAKAMRDALHMQRMEIAATAGSTAPAGGASAGPGGQERYVEIFLFSERPNKLRFKKTISSDGPNNDAEDLDASGVTKEQVVMECRDHMSSPGKGQLLLSMLGVALSQGARLYLKRTDQGLKHFLTDYPQEFAVEGIKGRECVSYLPAIACGGAHNSDLPSSFPEVKKAHRRVEQGTGGPASGSINDLQKPDKRWEEPAMVPQSPKVTEYMPVNDTPEGIMQTPSDWGTPWEQGLSRRHGTADHQRDVANASLPAFLTGFSGGMGAPLGSGLGGGLPGPPGVYPWGGWGMPAAQWTPPSYWGGQPGAAPWAAQDVLQEPMSVPGLLGGPSAAGLAGAASMAAALASLQQLPGGDSWLCSQQPTSLSLPSQAPSPPAQHSPHDALALAFQGLSPNLQLNQDQLQQQIALRQQQLHLLLQEQQQQLQLQQAIAHQAIAQQMQSLAPVAPQPTASVKVPAAAEVQPPPGSTVRLRGLPPSAEVQDVFAWFAKHDLVERIALISHPVRLLIKPHEKQVGIAFVDMNSPADADTAVKLLHNQMMGTRYIEVFHHKEGLGEAEAGLAHLGVGEIFAGSSVPTPTGGTGAGSSQLSLPQGVVDAQRFPTSAGEVLDPCMGPGDTGGSGGPASAMAPGSILQAASAAPWDRQSPWFAGSGGPGLAPGLGGLLAAPGTQWHGGAPSEAGAGAGGTGDGGPVEGDEQQSSWQALFDFLKQDDVAVAPGAGMHALGEATSHTGPLLHSM